MIIESTFNHAAMVDSIKRKMGYGSSLRKAGAEIGIGHATLGRFLNGEIVNPEMSTVLKICDWLTVSLQIFIHVEVKHVTKS